MSRFYPRRVVSFLTNDTSLGSKQGSVSLQWVEEGVRGGDTVSDEWLDSQGILSYLKKKKKMESRVGPITDRNAQGSRISGVVFPADRSQAARLPVNLPAKCLPYRDSLPLAAVGVQKSTI